MTILSTMWRCSLLDFNVSECCRFQSAEPAADGGAQVPGVVAGPRWVPAVGDDVRQLPQAAGLHQPWGDARQAAPRCLWGPALVPLVVNAPAAPSPHYCDYLSTPQSCLYTRVNAVSDTYNNCVIFDGAHAPDDCCLCAIKVILLTLMCQTLKVLCVL